MQTHKLIHLIQYHSERLAASLLNQVQMSERDGSYADVAQAELRERVYEIYHHVGSWLLDKSETDVEQRYMAIGARRAEQGVALNELVWVIVLTKRNLWKYIDEVSFPGLAVDLADKQEMLQLLDQFFDQAIHAAVVGYESASQKRIHSTRSTPKTAVRARKAS